MKYIKTSYEFINEGYEGIEFIDAFNGYGGGAHLKSKIIDIITGKCFGFLEYLSYSSLGMDDVLADEIVKKYYSGRHYFSPVEKYFVTDNKTLYDFIEIKDEVVSADGKSKYVVTFFDDSALHFYVCTTDTSRYKYLKVFYKPNANARPIEADYGMHAGKSNIGFGLKYDYDLFDEDMCADAITNMLKGTKAAAFMERKLETVKRNFDTICAEYKDANDLIETFPHYESDWDVTMTTKSGNVETMTCQLDKYENVYRTKINYFFMEDDIDELVGAIGHPKDAFDFGNIDRGSVNASDDVNEGLSKAYRPRNLPVDEYTLYDYYKDYTKSEHCEHCDKPHIVNIMVIKDPKGGLHKVGCECVKSLVDITKDEFDKWMEPFKLAEFYIKKVKKIEKDGAYECVFLADDANTYVYKIRKGVSFGKYVGDMYDRFKNNARIRYKKGRSDEYIASLDNEFMKKMLPKYYATAYYVKDAGGIESLFLNEHSGRNIFKSKDKKYRRFDNIVSDLKENVLNGKNSISWEGEEKGINGTATYDKGVVTVTVDVKGCRFEAVYDSNKK